MTLYITKNGQRMGPYSLDEIKGLKAKGQVQDNDWAWYEGLADWIPLSQVPGFASSPPPSPAMVPPPVPVSVTGSTGPAPVGGTVLVLRLVTAAGLFVISFVVLFAVLFIVVSLVGGGIAGGEAAAAQHAQGFQQGSQVGGEAGREFGEKYGNLIAGCSALAALVLSPLIAGFMAFSNFFPWCRRK